jgi:hypothetical protein
VDNFLTTNLVNITVAQVKSTNSITGSKEAFDRLESRMPSLRGRKMYGLYYPSTNEYYATVQLTDEFPDDMGFERGTIPSGLYAKGRIIDWSKHITEIKTGFEQLEATSNEQGFEVDHERPSIEYYRSMRELIILFPIQKRQ